MSDPDVECSTLLRSGLNEIIWTHWQKGLSSLPSVQQVLKLTKLSRWSLLVYKLYASKKSHYGVLSLSNTGSSRQNCSLTVPLWPSWWWWLQYRLVTVYCLLSIPLGVKCACSYSPRRWWRWPCRWCSTRWCPPTGPVSACSGEIYESAGGLPLVFTHKRLQILL